MIRAARRWHRSGEAQAVVELALALPLVMLMLLGLVQFGLALNARQELEGVARQGARTFALTGDIVSAEDVLQVAGRQLRDFDTRATVQINIAPPDRSLPRAFSASGRVSGIRLPPGFATAIRGYWVEVVVTYEYPNPIQATVLGTRILPAAVPLRTRAVARIEVDLK